MTTPNHHPLRGCPRCGLVQYVPEAGPKERVRCARCAASVACRHGRHLRLRWAAAFACAALVLYPLAVSVPIMEIERLGHRVQASIWSGSMGLLREGETAVGLLVFLCSIVLPLGKLCAICTMIFGAHYLPRRWRGATWWLVEATGRFGMLDVLLVAVIVAWVKLGDLAAVHPGPAALVFALCVLASLLAGAFFDPAALWEEETTDAVS